MGRAVRRSRGRHSRRLSRRGPSGRRRAGTTPTKRWCQRRDGASAKRKRWRSRGAGRGAMATASASRGAGRGAAAAAGTEKSAATGGAAATAADPAAGTTGKRSRIAGGAVGSRRRRRSRRHRRRHQIGTSAGTVRRSHTITCRRGFGTICHVMQSNSSSRKTKRRSSGERELVTQSAEGSS